MTTLLLPAFTATTPSARELHARATTKLEMAPTINREQLLHDSLVLEKDISTALRTQAYDQYQANEAWETLCSVWTCYDLGPATDTQAHGILQALWLHVRDTFAQVEEIRAHVKAQWPTSRKVRPV